MKIYYDDSLKEHCEMHKIIEVISWLYYFSHMWRKIVNYMNKCDLCHKIKSSRYKSYKEIKTVLVLNWSWTLVVMNFIIKLSLSKKFLTKVIYDLILTVVD